MGQPVGDAELGSELIQPRLVHRRARQVGGQRDVLSGGERRHEVEGLEHEPDPVAPQLGELGIPERPDLLLADEGVTRRRRIQAGHAMHQRRFPGPRRAHHRREAAPVKPDADPGQGVDGGVARSVRLGEIDGTGSRGLGSRFGVGDLCEHASQPPLVRAP